MSIKTASSLIALTFAAGLSLPALAQSTSPPSAPSTAPQTAPQRSTPASPAARPAAEAKPVKGQILTQPEGTFLASELIKAPVHAADKQNAGQVVDIIHKKDGSVDGVVIGVGGFLGLGSHSVALPFDAAQVTQQDGKLAVRVTADAADLEHAPPFKTSAQLEADRKASEPAPKSVPGMPGRTEK